jgi:hypothetical protein
MSKHLFQKGKQLFEKVWRVLAEGKSLFAKVKTPFAKVKDRYPQMTQINSGPDLRFRDSRDAKAWPQLRAHHRGTAVNKIR